MRKTKSRWSLLQSSNIQACCYCRGTQALVIQFHSGRMYEYAPVPWSVYMRFRRAKSHGSFFSASIRDNPRWDWIEINADMLSITSGDFPRDAA